MPIFVIGINHRTASVALREQIYFSLEKLPLYLQDLLNRGHAREAVLLSTCNRSELYCETDELDASKNWFCQQSTLPCAELASALYIYRDEEAVAHMMQVACGLDSMVLGEPQILGQMKEAFSESCAAGAVDTLFHRLFQQVFAIAKEIRTTTAIGACPVSVASAAVHFARQQFPELSKANVLLIGAGETTELLLRYLQPHLSKSAMIVNRGFVKASLLADQFGGDAYEFDALPSALAKADIVFSATGSAMPIVNKSVVEKAIMQRTDKPMMIIDIAVPRDVDSAVSQLTNVFLYCIDDLKMIIERNRQGREHAAEKAKELIKKKSNELIAELNAHRSVTHTIRAYRQQIEEICRIELLKAKQKLRQGGDSSQVLENFAQAFTKKLLHTPSVQLRQAGVEGRVEFLHFAKQLFAIPDREAEGL